MLGMVDRLAVHSARSLRLGSCFLGLFFPWFFLKLLGILILAFDVSRLTRLHFHTGKSAHPGLIFLFTFTLPAFDVGSFGNTLSDLVRADQLCDILELLKTDDLWVIFFQIFQHFLDPLCVTDALLIYERDTVIEVDILAEGPFQHVPIQRNARAVGVALRDLGIQLRFCLVDV